MYYKNNLNSKNSQFWFTEDNLNLANAGLSHSKEYFMYLKEKLNFPNKNNLKSTNDLVKAIHIYNQ